MPPLELGDASTERPHVIAFDPASPGEVADAEASERNLIERGFAVVRRSYGEVVMRPPARSPHLGVFRVLSAAGDERFVWDRRSAAQVREAYEKFKDFIKRGYRAYVGLLSGKRGHRLEDFDPGVEEIIMVPDTMPG